MTTNTLEHTITLSALRPLTEREWKGAVCRKLKTFGITDAAAGRKADQLYDDYVVERGFGDQDFSQDPVGAVDDDRHYWSNLAADPGR